MNRSLASAGKRGGTSYSGLDAMLRRRLIAQLAVLRHGRIRLRDEFGELALGTANADDPDRLEPFLAIDLANGRDDRMIVAIEDPIAEGERQPVLPAVDLVLGRIEPLFHHMARSYGISV